MGIFTDLFDNATTIDFGGSDNLRQAGDRAIYRDLNYAMQRAGDQDYPSGYDAIDEVQEIAAFGGAPSAGDFTLTISLKDEDAFTTAAIAYDADAATIEAAIDTAAAAASIAGFVAGDIAVTGGPLTTTPIVLTYSGSSVSGKNHGEVTIDAGGVTGGTAGAVSTTTDGQTQRTAWAILKVAGVVSGMPTVQGDTPSSLTVLNTRASFPQMISQDTIRALAHEAAVVDENEDVENEILRVLKLA